MAMNSDPGSLRRSDPHLAGRERKESAARGRRNRRAFVPGASARRRAAKARRRHRSRHRCARRPFQISRPRRARHPERDLARPQSACARTHRRAADARHRQGLVDARPRAPRRGGRFRRLSDRAAADGRDLARHPDRAARTERRHGPRQSFAGRSRDGHRHRLSHAGKARSASARARSPSPAIRCAAR